MAASPGNLGNGNILLVVLNTASGGLASEERRASLRAALGEAGLEARILPVGGRGEIAAALRPHLDHPRMVVAAGGDGTVSAVASLLIGTQVPLGVIPGGTLNHFAKDLQIPPRFAEAARVLRAGVEKRVDVATVNGRPFLNNSSLGLYPEMVLKRDAICRRGLRKGAAVVLAGIATLASLPRLRVRLDVDRGRLDRLTPFVFVGNNPYELEGLRLGTRPRLDAGQLCVCVARGRGRRALLAAMVLLAWGRARGLDVLFTRQAWIETRAPTVPVSLDGEVVRLQTPLRYEILPGALRVMAPPPGGPE